MALTNPNAVAGYAIPGGDLPVKNYSAVTAIAAGVAVKFDTANPGAGVYGSPTGVLLTSSDRTVGVTVDAIPAGKFGRVRTMGGAVLTAGATIHAGDVVMANAAGAAVPQTAGLFQLGTAANEALSGDPVLVILSIAKNA